MKNKTGMIFFAAYRWISFIAADPGGYQFFLYWKAHSKCWAGYCTPVMDWRFGMHRLLTLKHSATMPFYC